MRKLPIDATTLDNIDNVAVVKDKYVGAEMFTHGYLLRRDIFTVMRPLTQ